MGAVGGCVDGCRSGEMGAFWLWQREAKERGSPNQMAWMLNY